MMNHASSIRATTLPLIGRESLLATLAGLIEARESLITLHGPPGVGKSAILSALETGATDAELVLRVSLRGVRSVSGLGQAMATALAPGGAGTIEQALLHAWEARDFDLVLIDDAEEAYEALAEQLPSWIAVAPDTSFVVASRIALQTADERRLAVPPLTAEAAASLFERCLERRTLPIPDAALRDEILARLDGLPLAIELAAARAVAVPAEDLITVLNQGLAALRAPDHRSLGAALEASFTPLPDDVRRALARLSLLPCVVDLSLAMAVCGGDAERAEGLLYELWRRSLLLRVAGGFQMLDSVRERGKRELEDLDAAKQEIATALADRAFAVAAPIWGPRNAAEHRTLARLRPALQAVVGWEVASGEDRARALIAIAFCDARRLPAKERRRVLTSWPRRFAGASSETDALHGLVLARAASRVGDAAGIREAIRDRQPRSDSLRAALALAKARAGVLLVDRPVEALEHALSLTKPDSRDDCRTRAEVAYLRYHVVGDAGAARPLLDEAIVVLESAGDQVGVARVGTLRGVLAVDEGEIRARQLLDDAITVGESLGDDADQRLALLGRALALHELGAFDEAAEAYGQSIRWAREAGTLRSAAYAEAHRAALEVETGRVESAVPMLRRAIENQRSQHDVRAADFFEALLAFLEGREAPPDGVAGRRDYGERRARELLTALATARARGEDLQEAREDFGDLGSLRGEWLWRFAYRLPDALAKRPEPSTHGLRVSKARFRVDDGPWVDLSRRPTLRRVLQALCEASVGSRVTKEALFEAGWPDEPNTDPTSAARRVHTSIRRLRRLGLGDALASDREGYWIDRPIIGREESSA